MACIERRPKCGDGANSDDASSDTPLGKIGSVLGTTFAIIGAVLSVLKVIGEIAVVNGILTIGGVAVAGAGGAGAISGSAAAIAVIVIVGMYALDRCTQGEGTAECVSGVVREIVQSFSDALEDLFPFTAMHDRVDLVVKSRYWDVVESNYAKVFCTEHPNPEKSEILRTYYFTKKVCNAAKGALLGAIGGAVIGVIVGALAAAAITCLTVILCLFALLIAALIAAVAAIVGAFIGGQIAKAAKDETDPSDDSGSPLSQGSLVSVKGNMQRREEDESANVFWWVSSTTLHGIISSSVPIPYSYCNLDEELPFDDCRRSDPIR